MENNDKTILSDQTIGKEYQIPELVDLKGIGEAMGACINGSGAGVCFVGAAGGPPDD